MSLTKLLTGSRTRAAVRARLDGLLPEYDRNVRGRVKVPCGCKHSALVGTAFDYAARFELAHRAPHAVSRRWVAEGAVARLRISNSVELADAQRVVEEARNAVAVGWPASALARYALIATHAARLAQLDTFFRSGYPPTFGERDGIDELGIVDEVVQLLVCADPLWRLSTRAPLLLNPHFGSASLAVGGADADLVAQNVLIDIKTTKQTVVERDTMRQLVGYVALARASDCAELFAQIDTVAIYFARYGVLRTVRLPARVSGDEYVATGRWMGRTWEGVVAARRGAAAVG